MLFHPTRLKSKKLDELWLPSPNTDERVVDHDEDHEDGERWEVEDGRPFMKNLLTWARPDMRLRWGARPDVAYGIWLGASSSARTKLVVISNARQQRISNVS